MKNSINDNQLDDLIAGYVLGNLTIAEVDALKKELQKNPARLKELQSYQDAATLLPLTLDFPAPSRKLKNKILNAAQTAPRDNLAESKASSLRKEDSLSPTGNTPAQKRWPLLLSSCLGVLVVGLGFLTFGLRRQHQLQLAAMNQDLQQLRSEMAQLQEERQSYEDIIASLKQPNVVVFNLEGIGSGANSTASILATPGDEELVLVANQLPNLTEAKIYRLWALAKGASKPVYCGQFRHDDKGTARWRSPNASCSNNPIQLMVTLDAPEDPISSAGPLVLEGEI